MQFYFIRHAQSINNAIWAETGSIVGRSEDPELTDLGREQARLLGEYLRKSPRLVSMNGARPTEGPGPVFTHLYCSLMLRAVETASIIAETLDMPVYPWLEVFETGGIFTEDPTTGIRTGGPGKTGAFFAEHFPRLIVPKNQWEEGWWNRDFERREERIPRVRRFLQELLERHGGTDDRVTIVSHGTFYNHFMRVVLNVPEDDDTWFAIHNTGMTRLDFHNGGVGVFFTNMLDHLPVEMIT